MSRVVQVIQADRVLLLYTWYTTPGKVCNSNFSGYNVTRATRMNLGSLVISGHGHARASVTLANIGTSMKLLASSSKSPILLIRAIRHSERHNPAKFLCDPPRPRFVQQIPQIWSRKIK